MKYTKDDIITLSDDRKFIIEDLYKINSIPFLYLKNLNKDEYTIVKIIENKIYNLTRKELSLVISEMLLSGGSY